MNRPFSAGRNPAKPAKKTMNIGPPIDDEQGGNKQIRQSLYNVKGF